MRYIYMNEAIRDKKPKKPVIVVQEGNNITNSNLVHISYQGKHVASVRFNPRGLKDAPKHHVRAWVDVSDECEIKAIG